MTNDEREALIEKARIAFNEAWHWEDDRIERWDRDSRGKGTRSRAGIVAALAVFEQAHTPTDDERDWLDPLANVMEAYAAVALTKIREALDSTDGWVEFGHQVEVILNAHYWAAEGRELAEADLIDFVAEHIEEDSAVISINEDEAYMGDGDYPKLTPYVPVPDVARVLRAALADIWHEGSKA